LGWVLEFLDLDMRCVTKFRTVLLRRKFGNRWFRIFGRRRDGLRKDLVF
jgi:hypothetical protein